MTTRCLSDRDRETQWARLSELIAEHMGLHFPHERLADLQRGLAGAAREFGFDDVAACADWLFSAPPTRAQLQVLASHLTIGETYFFRDKAGVRRPREPRAPRVDSRAPRPRAAFAPVERGVLLGRRGVFARDLGAPTPARSCGLARDDPGDGHQRPLSAEGRRRIVWGVVVSRGAGRLQGALFPPDTRMAVTPSGRRSRSW